MNTKVLEYLLVIAQEKSLSRAAELLYCSQTTLSRHLQKIETELGIKLFTRVHNQMQLTDAGIIYMNSARAILYTEQSMMNELNTLRGEKKSSVRLMIDPYLYFFMLQSILPAFQAAYPNEKLMISEGSRNVAVDTLKGGLVDMAFLVSDQHLDPALDYHLMHREEYVLVVPGNMSDSEEIRDYETCGLEAFQEHCFLLERSDNVHRSIQREILQYFHFYPKLNHEVGDPTTAMQMVINGHGVSLLPDAKALARPDDLIALPIKPAFTSNLYVAVLKGEPLPPPARHLLGVIAEQSRFLNQYIASRHR